MFNPVDRLRFGAVSCEFCYPYTASIIPAQAEAVQPPVAATVAGRKARPISCAGFFTAVVQLVRFVPARAAVGSAAMPPGATPQTNQTDRTDAHEYPRPPRSGDSAIAASA